MSGPTWPWTPCPHISSRRRTSCSHRLWTSRTWHAHARPRASRPSPSIGSRSTLLLIPSSAGIGTAVSASRSPILSPRSHFLTRECWLRYTQCRCSTSSSTIISRWGCSPLRSQPIMARRRDHTWSSQWLSIWRWGGNAMIPICLHPHTSLFIHARASTRLQVRQRLCYGVHAQVVSG